MTQSIWRLKGRRLAWLAAITLGSLAQAGCVQTASADGEWRNFGGSKRMDRYSPLGQIDKGNVDRLQVAWTRPGVDRVLTSEFPDLVPSPYFRGTPIMVNGVLYAPNGVGLAEAFNPETGKTIWVQEPVERSFREVSGQSPRGLDHWEAGADSRIITVRGEYLYALDARTGARVPGFGTDGRVNLRRATPDNAPYFNWNGPLVVGDVIVVGGQGGGKVGEGYGDSGMQKEGVPEDIRGYDVRTGELVWTFNLMPPEGSPERETWGGDSASYVGHMGAWAALSADEELGYVYVPLTSPTNPYYGGHRRGDNLYANSLVALNAKTGKLVWYYQMVHHDLWDYDNASPPTLGDIVVGGRRIKAVMQPNKNAFLYVFDRVTGQPVWPITETPVPQSKMPGEYTSPTQPIPSKPAPFDRQGITRNDVIDFTPELKAEALKILDQYEIGPLYSPPSLGGVPGAKDGTIAIPSSRGAGNWNTGAFDPETGMYYAVSTLHVGALSLPKAEAPDATIAYARDYSRSPEPQDVFGIGPHGLPLVKPPYGRITAIDMNTGEHAWMVPNGDGPRNHPLLKDLNLPPLGWHARPVALVTKSLLFVAESSDGVWGAGVPGEAKFRAYDKADGRVLWETTLPAGSTGGPISYSYKDKQYIVVPIGNNTYGTAWIALTLDKPRRMLRRGNRWRR